MINLTVEQVIAEIRKMIEQVQAKQARPLIEMGYVIFVPPIICRGIETYWNMHSYKPVPPEELKQSFWDRERFFDGLPMFPVEGMPDTNIILTIPDPSFKPFEQRKTCNNQLQEPLTKLNLN